MSTEFPDVRLNGRSGSLTLTDTDIIFAEKSALRVSKSEWPLESVKEDILKPVTSSVDLKLEMEEFKDCLSFKMNSLSEVVRFRRTLQEKIMANKVSKESQEQEKDANPEGLYPIPETSVKSEMLSEPKTTAPTPTSITAVASSSKPAKSADSSPDETEATMSMSERTFASERSRPGVVRVEGSSQDRGSAKARRQPLSSSAASRSELDKRISARASEILSSNAEPDANKGSTEEPSPPSSESDDSPPGEFPLRDILSDDTSLDDISEFADDMPDQSDHQNSWHSSMNISSQSRGTYGRRRETLAASVTDLAKDLLTPTDHQKSLNESLHVSSSTGGGRRRETMVESVSDLAKMNSSMRSSTSSQRRITITGRGLRSSDINDSVVSNEPPRLTARDRLPSKLSSSVTSVSDSSVHRLSRNRRDSQKSQARILAQACAKEYKRVLSKKNLMKGDDQDKTKTTTVVSAQQGKLGKFETGTLSLAQHAISEKSGEWKSGDLSMHKSAEFSLHSAEEGRRSGTSAADPYNIGLIEARVVDDSHEFVRPSAVASAVNLEEEERQRKKMLYRFGAGCCVTMVIVVVLAALAATDVLGGGSAKEAVVAPPVLTPEERFASIEERISNVVYDRASLEDLNSPQRVALDWLVLEDKFHKDIIEVDAALQEKLEQRFTLAVFYFSMAQGSRWPHCRPPETGEVMACVHPVLESYANEGVYFDQKMSEPAFRWLSNTDECSWSGIKCRDGMHVSHVQLAGYQLQGSLPVEVGFLRSLEVLDLQQCGLVGSLPVEWGALETENSVLESIRLDQNLLTGHIPEEWCDLNSASLKNLVLSNNELTGSIPSCLSKFVELENFSVMNNQLTGTVPEMGTLLHLETFHVAGNNLSGKFPDSLCNLERYEMKEASADCKNILSDNYVQCPCCTTCCDGDDKAVCSLKHDMSGSDP